MIEITFYSKDCDESYTLGLCKDGMTWLLTNNDDETISIPPDYLFKVLDKYFKKTFKEE